MNGYKVIAVIFTALVSVFFPDEFFENIRVESIQYFAIWNTVISVAGWGFFSTKFFQLIKNQGKISIFIAVQKKKIATIAIGQMFNHIFDWFFNYPLYMFVIEKLGLTRGFVVMSVISFLTCLLFIQFYDWLKVDWLGIEVAKEVRDFGPEWIKKLNPESIIVKILWWPFSKIILIILWALKKGGFVAFVALSVYTDPFITTVYMRKGRHEYNGLSRKDWQTFIASTIVSNGYWAIITFAILESAKLFLKGVIG